MVIDKKGVLLRSFQCRIGINVFLRAFPYPEGIHDKGRAFTTRFFYEKVKRAQTNLSMPNAN
ncbi:MAG: hypothetical protein ACJA1B_002069 [Polaribacter sp.]|jgi:hypothetical protein